MNCLLEKVLDIRPAISIFRQRTEKLDLWVEPEKNSELSRHFDDIRKRALRHRKKEIFISDLSTSPIFFYRVFNGQRLWDIREESLSDFMKSGPIKVWQENSMYPKPGDVRRWLENII